MNFEGFSEQQRRVFEIVNCIPIGKVTSYGEVGALAGISGWETGRVLSGIKEDLWDKVAWQRVVAKDGFISSLKLGFRGQLQIELLTKEGVEIDQNKVDMNRFGISMDELSTKYEALKKHE